MAELIGRFIVIGLLLGGLALASQYFGRPVSIDECMLAKMKGQSEAMRPTAARLCAVERSQ
jgi:hypothetical protein